MKRIICVFILTLFLLGCSVVKSPIDTQTKEKSITLQADSTTLYLTQAQGDIKNSVAICFEGVELRAKNERNYFEKEIVSWLKEMTGEEFSLDFFECIQKPDLDRYERYFVDLTGKTVYRSEEIVSVIFHGTIYLKSAAHPMLVFFSLNYDPNTLETIRFSEIHSATQELYYVFASEGEKMIREENGGTWPQAFGSFSEVFCSKEEFLKGLATDCPVDQRIYFYYTEDKIGFSFSTVFALGGHKEVCLPRSLLENPQ